MCVEHLDYGMPQCLTNTMRICTKDAKNARYDATVPVKPTYSSSLFFERTTTPIFEDQEYCSTSPYEVPSSLEDAARADNPASMFSVGNVPMWDGTSFASNGQQQEWFTSTRKYPFESHDGQIVC
jgi:hypothetical protein